MLIASVASSVGVPTSLGAIDDRRLPAAGPVRSHRSDVFDHDGSVVDQNPHGQGKTAQRHGVQRLVAGNTSPESR